MGRAKEWQMEQWERGFQYVADRYVCDECVGDEALRDHIRVNATAVRCDYCHRESDDPIACELDTFLQAVADGVAVDWDDAKQHMPYDGDGWAFVDANHDIRDLIATLSLELHGTLYDDVVTAFEDRVFASRHFFVVSDGEALVFGWSEFVRHVSHRTRYLFSSVDPVMEYAGPKEIPPSQMLSEIGRVVDRLDLVQPMLPCELFRARTHRRDAADPPATATELGSPPEQLAVRSNRMSPLGIPMFYAAMDEATAADETRAVGMGADEALTVGVFVPDRALNVVNLVSLPPVPTVFEQHRLDVRPQLMFLHHFAAEVNKPVDRSQIEHLEYVPTQIVTEYFRHVFESEHGTPVDGLRYRSAARDGGECIVLFVDKEHCVAAARPGERTLALDRAYCLR